jgi:hypothetical protein
MTQKSAVPTWLQRVSALARVSRFPKYYGIILEYYLACRCGLLQPRDVVPKLKRNKSKSVTATELHTPYKELIRATGRSLQLPNSPP